MKICTLTLNPAIDTTIIADALHPDKTNRVLSEKSEAGGKGINVSRVLKTLGAEPVTYAVCGEGNLSAFRHMLGGAAGREAFVTVPGNTRDNLTLRAEGKCLKVNRIGAAVTDAAVRAIRDQILGELTEGDMLVVSGSVPNGQKPEVVAALCREFCKKGIRVALDVETLTLEDCKVIRPIAIKPNSYELAKMFGETEAREEELFDQMEKLSEAGVENVLVSLGGDGLAARIGGVNYKADALKVPVRSTVGAGDSTLAGFMAGLFFGLEPEECLALATACGASAVMQEGTGLAQRDEVERFRQQVAVSRF